MSKSKFSHFLETWHKTKTGLFVMGVFELGIAYIFGSWAIDSGNMLDYFFTILFLIGSGQNFVNVLRKFLKVQEPKKPVRKPTNAKRKPAKA